MIKEVPLAELTLRKYEKPYKSNERELIRKICLSLGLLQTGDGRDVVVDVLAVLINASKRKKELTSDEIKAQVEKYREENSLELNGIAESNIRRQLKRLADLMIIEKKNNLYRITEFEPLGKIFEERIEKFLLPQILERIKEYFGELEKSE